MPHHPLRRRSYLGAELERSESGLVVTALDDGGPAAAAGLRPGDRVLAIDGHPLCDLEQARRVVGALPAGRPCMIELARAALTAVPRPLPLEALPDGHVELDEVCWREHRLRAIWTFPSAPGPHTLWWLLPGATWLSDEHPTTRWHPVRRLVEQLTAGGVATLRVERSGLGDSEGPPCSELDLEAELAGFRAAFARIERRPAIDARRVFVFGRSLGGMLTPLVAEGRALAGIAVWGTTARRWHDAMLRASMRQYALAGIEPRELARRRKRLSALQSMVYEQALTPERAYARRPELREVAPTVFRGRHVYGRVASYFQQLQRRDLRRAFATIDAPLLALHGSADWLSELGDLQEIARLAPRGRWQQLALLDHHMHRRESLREAFAAPWGGELSPAVGQSLLALSRQTLARDLGSGKTPP